MVHSIVPLHVNELINYITAVHMFFLLRARKTTEVRTQPNHCQSRNAFQAHGRCPWYNEDAAAASDVLVEEISDVVFAKERHPIFVQSSQASCAVALPNVNRDALSTIAVHELLHCEKKREERREKREERREKREERRERREERREKREERREKREERREKREEIATEARGQRMQKLTKLRKISMSDLPRQYDVSGEE